MVPSPLPTLPGPTQSVPVSRTRHSLVLLIIPLDVFSDADARERRNDLLYRLENTFSSWRAGTVAAGSILPEYPVRVSADSFVIAVFDQGRQFQLAKAVLEAAVAMLPLAERQFCLLYTDANP